MTDIMCKMLDEGARLLAVRLHIETCKTCRDKYYEIVKCCQKKDC